MARKLGLSFFVTYLTLAYHCSSTLPAHGQVSRQDNTTLSRQLDMPVYQWSDGTKQPRALILAIHGLALHGTTYDAWARTLAKAGFLIVAPDLRGYGKWYQNRHSTIARYAQSEDDLAALASELRHKYPGLPLFLAGESLGGTLAIRITAKHPELIDGLILSAPAIKHQYHVSLRTAAGAAFALASPRHQIDVSPYIKNYYSDNCAISDEEISDPLVRKSLSVGEIVSSCHMMATTSDCIEDIPGNMPVLIMQGDNDRMIARGSIDLLKERLQTDSTSVHIFPRCGHILLETAFVRADVVDTVTKWIDHNCKLRPPDPTRMAREPNRPSPTGMD